MSFVVTLENYIPGQRYNDTPWIEARVEGAIPADSPTGTFSEVETFPLDPLDADPENPATRNFTTSLAITAEGWFRVVFIDALGAEQVTDAVYFPGPDAGLADNALTTLEAARGFLQKQDVELGQDDEIVALINAASAEIEREFEREFAPAGEAGEKRTLVLTRRPDRNGWTTLDLCPYDVRAVTEVKVDTDLAGTTLSAGDYKLRPLPSKTGVFQWLKLKVPVRDGEREVEVTGTWGHPSVPKNVEHWCNVTVAIWLRRDVAAFSTTFNLEEGRVERPKALPSAVLEALNGYRRASTRVRSS